MNDVVFIDLGAFDGASSIEAHAHYGERLRMAYLWEPHAGIKLKRLSFPHAYIPAAAGSMDRMVDLYISHDHRGRPIAQGSTCLTGKTTGNVDYDHPVLVQERDFARWLNEIDFGKNVDVIIKMNIEGAEYALLSCAHLWPSTVTELHIAWHSHKLGMTPDADEYWRGRLIVDGWLPETPVPFPRFEHWVRQ